MRGLQENNIPATGWDPHYAPTAEVVQARVVNLGFVINVIEDPAERRDALMRAFSLAGDVLVVSAMLATDNPGKVTLYADGVLTSRSTFQKYYTQPELHAYLATTLQQEPISVAPGIFFVFKDKAEEQRFLAKRQRAPIRARPLARHTATRSDERERRSRNVDNFGIHASLLGPLWAQCLELGREPDETEIPSLSALEEALGSLKKALRITLAHNNPAELERARAQRTEDLKVFFALHQFQRRQPYSALEPRLQRDVRAFFGDYASAQAHAKHALFQVASPEVLDECCRTASEQGLGWLEPSHSLQLHSSLVPRLPTALRIYVGCAGLLYGDVGEADVVKIHIRSGKVSFMKYDDFAALAIPKMTERAKVNLRDLTLELYQYGSEYPPPPLYRKSRYMNEEMPNYAAQLLFEREFESVPIDLSGYGPSSAELEAALKAAHWEIRGFGLERLHRVPHLDDACGRFLTYRNFIECGETQRATQISNLPANRATYTALLELATTIIDPVIEYFGSIELTYGFCSAELGRMIPGRVAPRLDQHAAAEHRKNGVPVCVRGGAAADLLVRDDDMEEVARWIIANLPFDRLYFYGSSQPIHVSYGPEHSRAAYRIIRRTGGPALPRPF